ncbi:MAG TPA: SUMF1/EgtB/PvdO family nonheme iron enzyme [Anaerolineaceae bacterium]|nr:SUMF1/EgtB/PvdO family nonheme iron enzyme [Anaerolineaceae bacterium]HPN52704.1 SUMF1/EgtB/PvdO family nonheme iron enzyme [Anaerolineaceae bacterium]
MQVFDGRKNRIQLEAEVGRGGEATIYRVSNRAGQVAKLYHTPPASEYAQKLIWMQQNPPEETHRDEGHHSIAWPMELLYGEDQALTGYLMPFIGGTVKIFSVINPTLRRKTGFDWRYLLRTARNLAAAVRSLHERDYVIGDMNESNILVTERALVTIIDADSFQVRLPAGRVYYCPVGKPEYTPPELQGVLFQNRPRRFEADYFGLAVLIFQLLMEGNHPFRGVWKGGGEPPQVAEKIRRGLFPYKPHANLVVPAPNTPPFEVLPPRLQELFMQTFVDGHARPAQRVSPRHWVDALATVESSLTQCVRERSHVYSNHLKACPWCTAPTAVRVIHPPAKTPPSPPSTRPVSPPKTTIPVLDLRHQPLSFGPLTPGEKKQHRLTVTNAGSGLLTGTLSVPSGVRWISLSETAFAIGAGKSATLQLLIDTSGLETNTHNTILTVKSNGGVRMLPVKLLVGLPLLEAAQTHIDFGNVPKGSQPQQTLTLRNVGVGPVSGSIISSSPWFTVSPTTFQVDQGRRAVVTLTPSILHVPGFPQREEYQGSLFVLSNGGNIKVTAAMTLCSPLLVFDPPDLEFGRVENSTEPELALKLTNPGSAVLNAALTGENWLMARPRQVSLLAGQETTVMVKARTEGLASGTYEANLKIESNGGDAVLLARVTTTAARLICPAAELDVGELSQDETRKLQLSLSNMGDAVLKGRVRKTPDWLEVPDPFFAIPPQETICLNLTVNANKAAGGVHGTELETRLNLDSTGGDAQVLIRARLGLPQVEAAIMSEGVVLKNMGKVRAKVRLVDPENCLIAAPDEVELDGDEQRTVNLFLGEKQAPETTLMMELTRSAHLMRFRFSDQGLGLKSHRLVLWLNEDIKMEFALVPEGWFWMGANPERDPLADVRLESPPSKHWLDRFWMGRYPVTVQQYGCFLKESDFPAPPGWKMADGGESGLNEPVTGVNWEAAQAFNRWLRKKTGWNVRLPGEAEWEKAARSGDGRIWPWGNEMREGLANVESEGVWPVGKTSPESDSPYGCADMSGNIWEWTASTFRYYPYLIEEGDEEGARVLRGGAWFFEARHARCTARRRAMPDEAREFIGFRCAI